MPYYWLYYFAPIALAFAERNPAVALVALVFVAVRPWLPDPVVLMKVLSRLGALKHQAALNPANIVVRRDLALAYLDLRRPRAALRYLDEALTRDPKNQELSYLRGLALFRAGDAEQAVRAFAASLGVDPDSAEPLSSQSSPGNAGTFRRYGEALLATGLALEELGRFDQAEEALKTSATYNSSTLEPLVRLSRVRKRKGDFEGSDAAGREARTTFRQLPGFMKRRQLGWWFRSWV